MPDEIDSTNDPAVPMPPRDGVPVPAQDGMVSVGQPAPKPASPPSVPKPPEHDRPAEQTESPAKASDIVKPPVATETVSEPDAEPREPTVAELDKSHEKSSTADDSKSAQGEKEPAEETQTGSKKTAPWAIVVAILTALLLSGIGLAAWRASNNTASNPDEQTQQTFDESDVDKLNQELDRIES